MNFKAIGRRWVAMLAVLVMLAAPAQAETFSAIVTSKTMGLYADQACSWKIDTLPMTTIVSVESYENGVAKISLGDREGYAAVKDMKALSDLAKPAEINANTYVFQQPNKGSRSLKVKKGMKVNLLAASGDWAMVENSGIVAYMNLAHLTVDGEQDEVQPEATQKPESSGIVTETFSAEVTAGKMRVYKSASTGSTCLGSVKKGTVVTVNAYNDKGWAYIELNGRTGFAKIADMKRVADPEPTPAPTEPPKAETYINDESISVEKRIYMFLTQEMKLNTAVACGILANVEKECSFRVTAGSYDGGYGIVQWTGSRNTRLKNWCQLNGYEYNTLEGQLWYLQYELENHYPKILAYLQGVENTPAGAYDAGYYFCYNFEIPANRATRSVQRGNLAKDSYWPKYA